MCSAEASIRSFATLRGSGMSRAQIDAALDGGHLRRLRRGVYGTGDTCAVSAAAAAHGGTLACVTAARHLGLWVLSKEEAPHVWMGRGGRAYAHEGCACVTHWDDGPLGDGFGVPSVPRILRQILFCRGVEEFFVVLESARRHGLIGNAGLRWLREHVGPAGREAIDYAHDDADSGLESLFRWRLRGRGLDIRTQVAVIGVGWVDALVGDCLLVELDGDENHDDEPHRRKDLMRDAAAAAWGYSTLRFTYAMVVHDWATVEAAVWGLVDRRRHLWPVRDRAQLRDRALDPPR